jgi:hypothetical protein
VIPKFEQYFSPVVWVCLVVASLILCIAGIIGNAVVTHEHETTKRATACAMAHETWTGTECHQ